jgi:hypothetical protein
VANYIAIFWSVNNYTGIIRDIFRWMEVFNSHLHGICRNVSNRLYYEYIWRIKPPQFSAVTKIIILVLRAYLKNR